VASAAVVALAAVFYLGGGWYFSGHLYRQALSGAAKRAAKPTYNVSVAAVTRGTVTLRVPTDPGQLLTPGVWGIQWPAGYGQVTRIVGRGDKTVTRDFRQMAGSPLTPGTRVALDNKAFPENPRVGLRIPFHEVSYQGPLGSYPAWFIPGSRDTWAVLLHGNSMDRLDTIKTVPALHRLGLPVLMVSYRNDAGAPEDPSGLLRYGLDLAQPPRRGGEDPRTHPAVSGNLGQDGAPRDERRAGEDRSRRDLRPRAGRRPPGLVEPEPGPVRPGGPGVRGASPRGVRRHLTERRQGPPFTAAVRNA